MVATGHGTTNIISREDNVPTLIDELLVSLSLDASAFERSRKQVDANLKSTADASARTAKQLQTDGPRAAEFFDSIRNSALALVGVFLGGKGLETVVRDATKSLSDLGRQALNIGEPAQGVEAFANAIARMGGNADAAKSSLQGFRKAQYDWSIGQNNDLPIFTGRIGASPTDGPLAVIQKFMAYIEKVKDLPGGIQNINNTGAGVGLDQGLVNSLVQIGSLAKYQAEIAKSIAIGVPTADMIKRMQEFQTSTVGLRQAFDQLANKLVSTVVPGLGAWFDQLTKDIEHGAPTKVDIEAINPDLSRDLGKIPGAGGLWDFVTSLFRADPKNEVDAEFRGTDTDHPADWFVRLNDWFSSRLGGRGAGPRAGGGGDAASLEMTPEVRAWADTISQAEGANYNTRYGGSTFDPNGPHPGNVLPGMPGYDPRAAHSPAGRYQITYDTWQRGIAARGLPDKMTPENQDKVFAWILAQHGITQKMLADPSRRQEVLDSLGPKEWASLPGSVQQRMTRPQLDTALDRYVSRERGRAVLDPSLIPPRGGPRVTPQTTNSTALDIGSITVNSRATDAPGIARDLHKALADQVTNAADRGPQ